MRLIISAIPVGTNEIYRRCGFAFPRSGVEVVVTKAEADEPIVAGEPFRIGRRTMKVLEQEAAMGRLSIRPADLEEVRDENGELREENTRLRADLKQAGIDIVEARARVREFEGELKQVKAKAEELEKLLAADRKGHAAKVAELEKAFKDHKKSKAGDSE